MAHRLHTLCLVLLLTAAGCERPASRSTAASQPANETSPFEQRTVVTLTPVAATQVRTLAREQNMDIDVDAFLHVTVKDRSPGHVRYGLDLTTATDPQTQVLSQRQGIRVLVDRADIAFLQDTDIDWGGVNKGNGFQFSNPNAPTTRPH